VKILEIIVSKLLGVGVHVYVTVQLLKLVFRCISSVRAEVISTQVELHTTLCRVYTRIQCCRQHVSCIGDKIVARLLLDTKGYKSTVT